MTTRHQHYVWQEYLEAWSTTKGKKRQIWCLRRDQETPFPTNTKNVAQERDFYRLTQFLREDADFIRALDISKKLPPLLKQVNDQTLAFSELFVPFWNGILEHPGTPAHILDAINKQLIEHEENIYGEGENGAVSQLAALQAGEIDFLLKADGGTVRFLTFLSDQYFRTKRIQDGMRAQYRSTPHLQERFDRTWPVIRRMYGMNVAWVLFARLKQAPPQLILAPEGREFLTSDQPVINTHAAFTPESEDIADTELFYPVSPKRALLISGHSANQGLHGQVLSEFRFQLLSQAMERIAHEQMFASRPEVLTPLIPTFCTTAAAAS